jgi:ferritin
MIGKKLEAALNGQLNAELYSAYLYLSMSSYLESQNLSGFGNWMRVQFEEEQFHAMKLFDYIIERGGRVICTPIAGPETEWNGPVGVFESTLEHEQKVTGLINDLVYLARDERDNAGEVFLGWFVSEQVEEESNVETILGKLRLAAGNPQALLMIDQELGTRFYTPPVAEGGKK